MFFSYSVDVTGNQRENRSYKEKDKEGHFSFLINIVICCSGLHASRLLNFPSRPQHFERSAVKLHFLSTLYTVIYYSAMSFVN